MSVVPVLAGIAWDPQVRGILSVLVGVLVLMGSIYLLLATNLASRLGFLLALVLLGVGLWRAWGLLQEWRRYGSDPAER